MLCLKSSAGVGVLCCELLHESSPFLAVNLVSIFYPYNKFYFKFLFQMLGALENEGMLKSQDPFNTEHEVYFGSLLVL